MAHHPERALRLFTFGTAPMFGKQFFIVWNRGVGWFFTAFGCFGAGVYLVMIAIDLFRAL